MASSSLTASVHSALHHMETNFPLNRFSVELRIGLRRLRALLIIRSRKLGNAHLSNTLPSLFSRIQDAAATVCQQKIPDSKSTTLSWYYLRAYFLWAYKFGVEVHSLCKQVDEECCIPTSSPLLTVGDVAAIADSILGNSRDFPSLIELDLLTTPYRIEVKAVDGFVEEIQFLRNFLVFANCLGAQLNNLLILIQPIVINAERVFDIDRDHAYSNDKQGWIQILQSKCSEANVMLTTPHIYHAYSNALSTASQYAGVDDVILMGFLDSLISLLWDVLRLSDSRPDQLIALYERLRFFRSILKQHLISSDRKIKERIGGLMRDSGSLICSIRHAHGENHLGLISHLLPGFDLIEAEIQSTHSQTSEPNDLEFGDHYSTNTIIDHGEEKDLKVPEDAQTSGHQPPQTATPQAVGFQDDEVQTVLDQLTRGSNQLRILPIYGMAGIGKTTFAVKLYNHRSTYQFQARAWCTISQELDKTKVLVHLLNQIDESESYLGMTEDDLADTLRKRLKGRRYLILLDDVWSLEVWNSLKMSFPDDSTQSRIILTSRNTNVSPHGLVDQEPYFLRLRENHECLEILQMKLYDKEGWNSDIGMEIAKLCKGLPLMAVIVSGLLASVKQEGWKGILDKLSSQGLSREEQCISSLELSYRHLPHDLKLCFLYIGAFPEDEQVSVGRLIRLWTAEGFVKKNGLKTSEDVGREYLENLTHRSLVMVAQSRSLGGAKSCRIHDIMRDFCMTKAIQENSFHIVHGDDQLSDFNQPECLQRLSINSNPIRFQKAKLFCPHAHSLLLFSPRNISGTNILDMSFIIQIFQLLKVLDLQQFCFVSEIPNEIEVLTRLTYLSVKSQWAGIPYSICNLSNLETLIIQFILCKVISFPDTLWNLQKLKYLKLNGVFEATVFSLPNENPESSSNLSELETLFGIQFKSDGSMEKVLKKFSNISKLKCAILPHVENSVSVRVSKIVIPEFLNQLQSLNACGNGKLQCEIGSAQKLRKVTLRGFNLSREEISVIGKLSNLNILKLLDISFPEGAFEMEEGDFSKLEIFHLTSNLLTRWTASDEQLPNLQKLVLRRCKALVEIPSTCLETSTTLEEIQVYDCFSTLESLVRDIESVHEDFGNFIKVIISSLP